MTTQMPATDVSQIARFHAVPRRSREWLAFAFVGVIALGLASRKWPMLAGEVGKYPGDALWTVMVYVLMAWLRPGVRPHQLMGAAVAVSFLVEFSQALTWPWLVHFRATTVGHLMLGSTFNPPDLLAYAVGGWMGWCLDRWWLWRS